MSRPGFQFESSCPACEAPLQVINASRPPSTYETWVIVACTVCRLEAELSARLLVTHDPRYSRPPRQATL